MWGEVNPGVGVKGCRRPGSGETVGEMRNKGKWESRDGPQKKWVCPYTQKLKETGGNSVSKPIKKQLDKTLINCGKFLGGGKK